MTRDPSSMANYASATRRKRMSKGVDGTLNRLSGADLSPDWSPNADRIAFESNIDGNAEIYTMNADGSFPETRSMLGAPTITEVATSCQPILRISVEAPPVALLSGRQVRPRSP